MRRASLRPFPQRKSMNNVFFLVKGCVCVFMCVCVSVHMYRM